MAIDISNLLPPVVPLEQNYWVVRAGVNSGEYQRNFRKDGIIAIGHIDGSLSALEDQNDLELSEWEIEKFVHKDFDPKEFTKGQITSASNQVKSFLHKMKIGDIVVTPGDHSLLIGKVTSLPFKSSSVSEVVHDAQTGASTTMNFSLRRSVSWGPLIKRTVFPYNVTRSLRAQQTVFNIEDHWQAINHLLHPVFIRGEDIFASISIKQKDDIKNHHVTTLLTNIDKLEIISSFSAECEELSEYDGYEENYYSSEKFKSTSKAQFMSEGDIFLKVSGFLLDTLSNKELRTLIFTYFFYSMMFGSSKIGLDGLIDREMRHKIFDLAASHFDKKRDVKSREELKLDIPRNDTSFLSDKKSKNDGE